MNNEIKQIKIKTIGQLLDFVETEQKAKELIDYITNLQEEYKKIDKEYSKLIYKYNKLLNQKELYSGKYFTFYKKGD